MQVHPVVSVIVPAYNCEDYIAKSIGSLQKQTIGQDNLEIVIVNDGSTDDTFRLCRELASQAGNIVIIDKPNGGVSNARNAGIDAARGKYIAFLDGDDTLLPDTLKAAVDFFDAHYDEIDVVSYPMRLYDDKREWSHVREQVLTETGVYDLAKPQYAFALITNMNAVVKNNDDLPRFREDLDVHEDEQFFMSILLKKQKVGFSKAGAYRYQQRSGSATSTRMHPYYQFEKNIGFWEELFSHYPEKAPLYLQASFLNEINWKLKKDLLFPYHYNKDSFDRALQRISSLVDRVDNDIILTAPRTDEYLQHYVFSLKTNLKRKCEISENGITIASDRDVLFSSKFAILDIIRTRASSDSILLRGILKSLAFNYFETPILSLQLDNEDPQTIPLRESSHGHNGTHIVISKFWGFEVEIPASDHSRASFSLTLNGKSIPIQMRFSSRSNLDSENAIFSFCQNNILFSADQTMQGFLFEHNPSLIAKQISWLRNTCNAIAKNPKVALVRIGLKLHAKRKRPLWLYYDRGGVGKDNAYYQFLHDCNINDGIERFYVVRGNESAVGSAFEGEHADSVVGFGSLKHRFLHLQADKIIASYIEFSNWCPFSRAVMRGLADQVHYDLVYLQHGVLHAHMPWKYSADHLLMDFEVVSTDFETSNLTRNYGFSSSQLISCGMPRYDFIDPAKASKHKILFAPSWRKNLVSELSGLRFEANQQAFQKSSFWLEIKQLLSDQALFDILERHDYELDIKLHPIFKAYEEEFEGFTNKRIRLVDQVYESDYRVFITDYSSWVFDFVYLNRTILYFFPDEEEFHAGLNGYRKLDLPLEKGFGPITRTGSELLRILANTLERDGQAENTYRERMKGFFLHYDNGQRERLYQALMDTKNTTPQ